MQSLLRRGTSFFGSSTPSTPTPESTTNTKPSPETPEVETETKAGGDALEFRTAPSHDKLFTKVDPAVDGEDCLHDCASCTVKYPARFEVDQEDELYGNVNGWATHLLVATGKTDWVRDVADEGGSVMEAVERGGVAPSNGKLKLSASNMPVPDEYHFAEPGKQATTVLLLPAFTIVDNVTPSLVPDLITNFVDRAVTTTTPLHAPPAAPTPVAPTTDPTTITDELNEKLSLTSTSPPTQTKEEIPSPLRSRPCPHSAVILLCSQRTRDARCGQSAPLLRKEFERHLRPLGLYRDLDDERPGGVGIYFISHVGGHKYSANVIVYRRGNIAPLRGDQAEKRGTENEKGGEGEGAAQGIWLARVRPEDCENIIRYTVLQGKVVKPKEQLRGGFDRARGVISW